jgi:hypothetical protein
VRVIERQASGRIHYHLVVVTKADIRRGVNFEEFANKTYKSAPVSLRSEWAFWRRNASAYGFGRTELLPVKTNSLAVARYVGKYISKHIGKRQPCDRRIRLVSYSRGSKIGTTNFAWASPKSWLWRAKLAKWALRHGCDSLQAVAALFGPRWAYHHRTYILATKLDYWPTAAHAALDGFWLPPELRDDAIHIYRSRANKISAESSSCDSSQAVRGVVPPEPRELREPGGEGSCSTPRPAELAHKEWIERGAYQLRKLAFNGKISRLTL